MKTAHMLRCIVAALTLVICATALSESSEMKPAAVDDQSSTIGLEAQDPPQARVRISEPLSGDQIHWQVISSGGSECTSTSYVLNGTVSQTAVGVGVSTSYRANHGFWQDFGVYCIPGDANGSGGDPAVDIDDIVYLIEYVFAGGPAPIPAICCGDADGSGGDPAVDIDDIVYLINYVFNGGWPPMPNPC